MLAPFVRAHGAVPDQMIQNRVNPTVSIRTVTDRPIEIQRPNAKTVGVRPDPHTL